MRVFWLNGNVCIHPESTQESALLSILTEKVPWTKGHPDSGKYYPEMSLPHMEGVTVECELPPTIPPLMPEARLELARLFRSEDFESIQPRGGTPNTTRTNGKVRQSHTVERKGSGYPVGYPTSLSYRLHLEGGPAPVREPRYLAIPGVGMVEVGS